MPPVSPALAGGSLPLSLLGSPRWKQIPLKALPSHASLPLSPCQSLLQAYMRQAVWWPHPFMAVCGQEKHLTCHLHHLLPELIFNLHLMSLFVKVILLVFQGFSSVQFSSVAQSCPTHCDHMNCSTPRFPVHHQLPEFTQTHVHESVMPSSHLIVCCPLSSFPRSLPASEAFPMSQLFT